MSTTDTTKDTSTYVRSSDTDKDKSGKNKTDTTTEKSKTETTYGSHKDDDNTTSYSTSHGRTGATGTSSTQYGQHDTSSSQYGRSGQYGQGGHSQQEVQTKLKEVGHLLQRAGQMLQDLQVSAGDWSCGSFGGRGQGGNYSGPYGGFESQGQYGGGYGQSSQYSGQYSQLGGEHTGRYQQLGGGSRFDSDRERDQFSSRGRFDQDRDRSDQFRGTRDTDRFGGFGGPNRPDMGYGGRYGGEQTFVRDSDRSGRW